MDLELKSLEEQQRLQQALEPLFEPLFETIIRNW